MGYIPNPSLNKMYPSGRAHRSETSLRLAVGTRRAHRARFRAVLPVSAALLTLARLIVCGRRRRRRAALRLSASRSGWAVSVPAFHGSTSACTTSAPCPPRWPPVQRCCSASISRCSRPLAGYLFAAAALSDGARLMLFLPAVWTLLEWTRGWLFTGFPWLATGYSQVPASPLAGYAPVFGIYGVTLALLASAGSAVVLWTRLTSKDEGKRALSQLRTCSHHPWQLLHSLILLAIWLGGWALKQVAWTHPAGAPVRVSLLQGNIAQDLKWREDHVRTTLESYRHLAEASDSRLIILPETALPLFLQNVPPEYLQQLAAHARKNHGDILIGVPERLPGGDYYNSVVSFGTAPTQNYRKSHLVPFGEFIPLRALLGPSSPCSPFRCRISRAARTSSSPSRRGAERRDQHLLRGRLRRRNHPPAAAGDTAGQRQQRRLVRPFDRAPAASADLAGARARDRPLHAARHQYRHHGRHRSAGKSLGQRAGVCRRHRHAIRSRAMQGITPYVSWGNTAVLALIVALLATALGLRTRKTRA